MSLNVGDKSVKKLIIAGQKFIPENSTDLPNWKLLTLPSGISGTVYYRDNNNGTMSLMGIASMKYPMRSGNHLWIAPPSGYTFTSIESGITSTYSGDDDTINTQGPGGIFELRFLTNGINLAYATAASQQATSSHESLLLIPDIMKRGDAPDNFRNFINVNYTKN